MKTLYNDTIEDLSITVEYLHIELINFIDPVSLFNYEVFPNVTPTGTWIDDIYKTSCRLSITLLFRGTEDIKPSLSFTGKFMVKRDGKIEEPYVIVRVVEYCYSIIEKYIKDKPIADKEGNLFPMPLSYAPTQFDFIKFKSEIVGE